MFYLSNFARSKGAKDKRKRKARSILAKSVRDGLIGATLLVPTFYATRQIIAKPLVNKRFKARKELLDLENKRGNKSLENEFANVFLKDQKLENLRQEHLKQKLKNHREAVPLKDFILPSLALSPSIATISLVSRAKKEGFGKKEKEKRNN
jgi:hypothetical protein